MSLNRSEPTLRPEELRPHYGRFLREGRILLTGHSHQAWPDAAREGVLEAFDDAAAHVDDKWSKAAEAADALKTRLANELGGAPSDIALAQNSHELVARFLSALDWSTKRHVVTSAGEFHSISRQLARLEEEGVEVTRVPVEPRDTLAERIADAVRKDTAAVLASTVLFQTSALVPHLQAITQAGTRMGVPVLFDAYHHIGALPWTAIDASAYVSGGGYKYLQWGEGCCFMRVPAACDLRPVHTGWFSDFASLASGPGARVGYGSTGADRFAGSTYDPVSHYRARAVIRFFDSHGMTPAALRSVSLQQTSRIMEALKSHEILTPLTEERGGFVTVRVSGAGEVVSLLRERGVFVDSRQDRLRFGPAPYLLDEEIDAACAAFQEVVAG